MNAGASSSASRAPPFGTSHETTRGDRTPAFADNSESQASRHAQRRAVKILHTLYRILQGTLFFGIPGDYERTLEEIFNPEVISPSGWQTFVDRLRQDASQTMLIAAILLNANVALLAIPNVDQPSTLAPNRVRIFSYISVATSLGSIGFGFGAQLAGLNNLHPPSTSPSWFLPFALVSAMPTVCLIWAFIGFCAATLFMMLKGHISDHAILGICLALLFVVMVFFWGVLHSITPPKVA